MSFENSVLCWYVLLAVFAQRVWAVDRGVGIALGFLMRFWMDYGLGALLYLMPWVPLPDVAVEQLGFTETCWAFGALFVGWLAGSSISAGVKHEPRYSVDNKLPVAYLLSGAFSQFVLSRTVGQLPSINALVACANSLVVVGFVLWCWQAYSDGGKTQLLRRLSFTLLLPAVSLLGAGFMSFGTSALLSVLMFVAQIYRPRRAFLAMLLLMIFTGLTFYVNYMRDRSEIRTLVWGGADLSERAARVWQTITTSQILDFSNSQHVEAINERLNQTILLGTAVAHLDSNDAFFGGSTIVDGFLAIIPRFLWPNKPMAAGSMGLATQMTGLQFATGTSVGIGFVMELYGNFGRWGVIGGFLVIGFLVQLCDAQAARCLREQDWLGFCGPYLIGLAFVYSWNTVELMMAIGGSLAVAYLIRGGLHQYQRLRERIAVAA